MKYLDEYREPALARTLIQRIQRQASRRWVLMDVCGGQTHSLVRSGIERALTDTIELIHGPGCPVCVTPIEVIDFAIRLSQQPNTVVASFGDMLRVPGSRSTLVESRAQGGRVQVVYSPCDAVRLARQHPETDVVFLGVGFETTAPSTALSVLQASRAGLNNFSIVPAHVLVKPAMEAIMRSEHNRVQGFLAAGHVCTVTGFESYEAFVADFDVPVVVTGFEPIDLLSGIMECVRCLETGDPQVINRYGRSVTRPGNRSAQQIINQVYQVSDRNWRGFGRIPGGGLSLRSRWRRFDAEARFAELLPATAAADSPCRAAEVMSGKIKPKDCAEFGSRCTPESPLGAPMVSSEGACAAYFRFDPIQISVPEKVQ